MNDSARVMNRLRSSFSTVAPSSNKTTSVDTTQGKLDLLDKVLTQIENQVSTENDGVLAQAVTQATLTVTDTLNPEQPTTSLKEAAANISPDIGPIEAGAGLQQIEHEPNPELSTEVESFLQRVEDQQDQALKEVVIADGTTQPSLAHPPVKKPVIILPITQEEEKEGKTKSLHWSIRWLVEWSQKLMKMFAGEVIYRQETTSS